jgi:hypothetical protein
VPSCAARAISEQAAQRQHKRTRVRSLILHHKSHTADWDVRAYIGHAFVRILTTSWISVVKNHHPESSSTPLQKNAAVVFYQLSGRFVHSTQSTQQHIKQALCAADHGAGALGLRTHEKMRCRAFYSLSACHSSGTGVQQRINTCDQREYLMFVNHAATS